MKSIALCETGFFEQSATNMEEEKSRNCSGEADTSESSKKVPSDNGCQEDSSISAEEILENGDRGSGPFDGDSRESLLEDPDRIEANGAKTEPANKPERDDDAESVNEVKDETDDSKSDDSFVVSNEAPESGNERMAKEKIRDVCDRLRNERMPLLEEIQDACEILADVSAVTTEEVSPPRETEESENERKPDLEIGDDGIFDEEGNKENEKSNVTGANDVYLAGNEEECAMDGGDDDDEPEGSDRIEYNIKVGDCQSVPIPDGDASWGDSKDSKELGEIVSAASTEDEFGKPLLDNEKLEETDESYSEKAAIKMETGDSAEVGSDDRELKTENPPFEDLVSDNRPEDVASESRDEEDSALAIQIDEDPITETRTDDDSAPAVPAGEIEKDCDSKKITCSEEPDDSSAEKERRKAETVSFVDSADEEADDPDSAAFSNPPTPSENSDFPDGHGGRQRKRNLDLTSDETETNAKKSKLSEDENSTENVCESETTNTDLSTVKKTNLEETIDMVATNKKSLPFLENLRGTLKNLTRSDLEELTVQKLCEVITERSSVGELRRRAQALEQDQEKWKEKVQSLTKQLREMEMVMKKYMSEVQKQNKEKNFQMVTPIRVTRSVGLQVSFSSNANKAARTLSGPNAAAVNASSHLGKGVSKPLPSKQPLQTNPNLLQQNVRKPLPVVTAATRTVLSPPKNLTPAKKPPMQKPGTTALVQNRPIAPQPLVNNNRLQQQNQIQTAKPAFKIASPQQQQQQTQQPQQTGSRVIDLTDDDERQGTHKILQASPTVRGPVRVVNHLQQSPTNQNGRVFHLVPATAATAGPGTQNRQIVIAASAVPPQNRQMVSSMPPLIFKGGNIVPAGPQAASMNQHVRPLAPKQFRHPAPLPQAPPGQIHRPNWKLLPPRPALKISRVQTGIVLSWNMNLGPEYEPIASYQLYAYQESNAPPTTSLWKKVGDVKALPLPMACTLTQFMTGHKYHFAVRAVDVHSRVGPFSASNFIVL